MSPPPELLADVDRRIAAASRELAVARERFPAATPGPGRVVCEAAEAMLDERIDPLQKRILADVRGMPSAQLNRLAVVEVAADR